MKHRSGFFTFFPPPKFLAMSALGLDISDRSIRFAELVEASGGFELGRFGERELPQGVVVEGQIIDVPKVREVIAKLGKDVGIRYVRAALPEQHGYLVKMNLPLMRKDQIRESVELQLEEFVPISAANAIFDYAVVECGTSVRKRDHLDVGVSVMPKKIVEDYVAIFEGTGITPLSFELEAQAMARAVLPAGECGTYMIVDIGGTRTGIFVISEGIIRFTSTINLGGDALTKAVADRFSLNTKEARELKERKGVIQTKENEEIANTLLPLVSSLQGEINRHYQYWHTHQEQTEKTREPISRIIMCGGEASLPGLRDYLARVLRADTELANPWRNVNTFDEYIPQITFQQSLKYSTALGLAMLSFEL